MDNDTTSTARIQHCLDRLAAGDQQAKDLLLEHASEHLTRLSRKLLGGFPQVRRWEQTDDVFQGASIRLCRALEQAKPVSPLHFFRLAALQIRRELIDLARHYQGARGWGANHASQRGGPANDSSCQGAFEAEELTNDPQQLVQWAEFHRLVEQLPDEQREIFDLLWYQGLSQEEAAALIGVTARTVKRRWRSARLTLHAWLEQSPAG